MDIKINKPKPIEPINDITAFKRGDNIQEVIKILELGEQVLVTAFFNNGLLLLQELKLYLKKKFPKKNFSRTAKIQTGISKVI